MSSAADRSKAMALVVLITCLFFLSLFVGVLVSSLFMNFTHLTNERERGKKEREREGRKKERESWLFNFSCLTEAMLLLVFCVCFSRYHMLACNV